MACPARIKQVSSLTDGLPQGQAELHLQGLHQLALAEIPLHLVYEGLNPVLIEKRCHARPHIYVHLRTQMATSALAPVSALHSADNELNRHDQGDVCRACRARILTTRHTVQRCCVGLPVSAEPDARADWCLMMRLRLRHCWPQHRQHQPSLSPAETERT